MASTTKTTTCGNWVNESINSNSNKVIIGTNANEKYCSLNNYLIDLDREIFESDSEGLKEEKCCNDILCSSYSCPENYNKKVGSDNEFVFNDSGVLVPLQNCCEAKTCDEWILNGNNCREATLISNKIGFSKEDCCFETCGNWNERLIKEKIKQRFPLWNENVILSEDTSTTESTDTSTTEENINDIDYTDETSVERYIQRIVGLYGDTGSPTEFFNCSSDEYLLPIKQGSDNITCCENKKNTCFYKEWNCPENKYNDNNKLLSKCIGDNLTNCTQNDANIELCCKDYQKCNQLLIHS